MSTKTESRGTTKNFNRDSKKNRVNKIYRTAQKNRINFWLNYLESFLRGKSPIDFMQKLLFKIFKTSYKSI